MTYYLLDENHNVVETESMEEWSRLWNGSSENRIVQKTFLADGNTEVSTVFLGIDQSFSGGPPLLFETMVFPDMEICQRYSTWDDAEKGHWAVVSRLEEESR